MMTFRVVRRPARTGAALGVAVAAMASLLSPAGASTITYDVNMSFDPTMTDGAAGVGTITGTLTLDTSTATPSVTAVDLTESTNDGQQSIGGEWGSTTYSSFTFNQVGTFSIWGVAYPFDTISLNQANYEFNGQPFVKLWFQSNLSIHDGLPVGPTIQFDFAYPQGGPVRPGNFDSFTEESRFLYGSVTPASAVPEPSTWMLMTLGFAALGFAGYRASRAPKGSAADS